MCFGFSHTYLISILVESFWKVLWQYVSKFKELFFGLYYFLDMLYRYYFHNQTKQSYFHFAKLKYSWLLNTTGVRGTDPHTVKTPCYNLQSALCTHSSLYTDSINYGLCSTVVYTQKKSTYNWTWASQTHVVQESTVVSSLLLRIVMRMKLHFPPDKISDSLTENNHSSNDYWHPCSTSWIAKYCHLL